MKLLTILILGSLFISCGKKVSSKSESNPPVKNTTKVEEKVDESKDFNQVDKLGRSNATYFIMQFDEGGEKEATKLLELLKTKSFDFNHELNVERLFIGLKEHKEEAKTLLIYKEFIKGIKSKRFITLEDYSLVLSKIAANPFYLYNQVESKEESFTSLVKFIEMERPLYDSELKIVESFNKKFEIN